jgi:hypothetical protein
MRVIKAGLLSLVFAAFLLSFRFGPVAPPVLHWAVPVVLLAVLIFGVRRLAPDAK